MRCRVQAEDFDLASELAPMRDLGTIGAIASFVGYVKNEASDPLIEMVIEHYPSMTTSAIEAIAREAIERWGLIDVSVVHRFGALKPGDQIMMVATAAKHRSAAFEAAEFLMDFLKSRAPFWKKEVRRSGQVWVDSQDSDEIALERWDGT